MTEREVVRFNVYNKTPNFYAKGVILPFDNIDFNIGGSYDTSTYKYTFLKSGTYLIGVSYSKERVNDVGLLFHQLLRNGVVSTIAQTTSRFNATFHTINGYYIYKFEAGDVIYHQVQQGIPKMNVSSVPDGDIYNSWWGIRLDY